MIGGEHVGAEARQVGSGAGQDELEVGKNGRQHSGIGDHHAAVPGAVDVVISGAWRDQRLQVTLCSDGPVCTLVRRGSN